MPVTMNRNDAAMTAIDSPSIPAGMSRLQAPVEVTGDPGGFDDRPDAARITSEREQP
jgi:hypothetical protein